MNKPIGYFEKDRMENVLQSESIKVPTGNSIEETRQLILSHADIIPKELVEKLQSRCSIFNLKKSNENFENMLKDFL